MPPKKPKESVSASEHPVADLVSSQLSYLYEAPLIPEEIVPRLEASIKNSGSNGAFSPLENRKIARALADIEKLRRNHRWPTKSDHEVINAGLRSLDDQIAYSEINILATQVKINALLHEIGILHADYEQKKEQKRDLAKALQPTIQLLPPSIILHIASYLTNEILDPPISPPLLAASRICRTWRTTCLNSSSLWADIYIDLSTHPDSEKNVLRILPSWFQRVNKSAVRLSINSTRKKSPYEILPAVLRYSSQLLELRMNIENEFDLEKYMERARFPRLETFVFSTKVPPRVGPPPRSVLLQKSIEKRTYFPDDILRFAPRLRQVYFDFRVRQTYHTYCRLPWHQLTHLHIHHHLDFSTWHGTFSDCTELHEASFIIRLPNRRTLIPPSAPIIFKKLSSLSIYLEDSSFREEDPEIPFQNFSFPLLQDLALIYISGDPLSSIGSALRQTSLAATSLRRLVLARVAVGLGELVAFLSACNFLEDLRLDLPRYKPNEVCDALRSGVGDVRQELKMPRLASFFICFCVEYNHGHDNFSPGYLEGLIRQWHLGGARSLTHVEVFLHASKDPGTTEFVTTEPHPTLLAIQDSLMTSLNDCIRHEVLNPAGLVLAVKYPLSQYIKELSPIIPPKLIPDPHTVYSSERRYSLNQGDSDSEDYDDDLTDREDRGEDSDHSNEDSSDY